MRVHKQANHNKWEWHRCQIAIEIQHYKSHTLQTSMITCFALLNKASAPDANFLKSITCVLLFYRNRQNTNTSTTICLVKRCCNITMLPDYSTFIIETIRNAPACRGLSKINFCRNVKGIIQLSCGVNVKPLCHYTAFPTVPTFIWWFHPFHGNQSRLRSVYI